MIDIERIHPRNDNVLLQLEVNADPHAERLSPTGRLILPQSRSLESEDAIFATVVAAGPGCYADAWLGHEEGTAPVGSKVFVPVDPAIRPGARVVLSKAGLAADRVWSDSHREYRMVRATCIEAVVET